MMLPIFVLCLLASFIAPKTAVAQTDSADSAARDQDSLARAKELFREGVALYQAGEVHTALDRFRRSRELYPTAKNTVNAALCLEQVDQLDEALELYQMALARHQAEMNPTDLEGVHAAMARLRKQVGNLTISYTVAGNVVIDGRPRGSLPLAAPLRVMPGRHVVRVIKNGYATFESSIEVRAGETASIDARLQLLTDSGMLRVEDEDQNDAQVVVDGAVVGACPWEGVLAPGAHLVQVLSGKTGDAQLVSMPTAAVVVRGQTTLLRLSSAPAGPKVFLEVMPSSAELSIDGVMLGRGRWEGLLPAGTFQVTGAEEGYVPKRQRVVVGEAAGAMQRVSFRLVVDETHPRWPKQPAGRLWLQGFGGMAWGLSMRSGPENDCWAGCSGSTVVGGDIGGRIGYELPFRLSAEVLAGYMMLRAHVSRGHSGTYGSAEPMRVDYSFDDAVRFKGPFVGGGLSYPAPVGSGWVLRSRISAGVVFAKSLDEVTGTARSSVDELDVFIEDAGRAVHSTPWFVMPELGAEHAAGPFVLGASVGMFVVPQSGPELPIGTVSVPTARCYQDPASAACARQTTLAGERAYGPFFVLVPTVYATYAL